MIPLKDVIEIHETLIDNFGGAHSVRDLQALESALARPFQTFDGKQLYETPVLKAASLLESILMNHPFIDGNKRAGYMLLRLFLLNNHLDIYATQDEKYNFIISVASGKMQFENIAEWITHHVAKST